MAELKHLPLYGPGSGREMVEKRERSMAQYAAEIERIERGGMPIVWLPQAIYDAAKAAGIDMTGYAVTQRIPLG